MKQLYFAVRTILLMAVFSCMAPSPARAGTDTPGAPAPGRMIVELAPTAHRADTVRRLNAALGCTVHRYLGRDGRFALVSLPPQSEPRAAARLATRQQGIVAAAPDCVRKLVATPNDTNYATYQWALNNTGQYVPFDAGPAMGTPDADIDAPEAWDLTTGTATTIVAVIDTGYTTTHTELMTQMWTNTGEIPGNGIDDDGNGYVDDMAGYDFRLGTSVLSDEHGHGTFCSGIIGARGDNSNGVCGVNWRVSMMALKCFDPTGNAYDSDLVEAIVYAADNGARVINASWGDYVYSPVLESAIRYAGDRGVLFVAAAGNDGACLKEEPFYPAACTLPNLVCVGSTNFKDAWSTFSNFDDVLVDVFAPGENVYSLSNTGGYRFGSGTSYATPHVVGVAALLLSHEPALSVEALRSRLISGVDTRSALQGRSATGGRISAYRAVATAGTDVTAPAAVNDLTVSQAATNGLYLSFTAPGDDANAGQALAYDVRISTAPIDAASFAYSTRVHGVGSPRTAGSPETLLATQLEPNTTYYVRVKTRDDAGNLSALSNQATAVTSGRTIIFSDNMESGPVKWSVAGTFALTTETAHTGSWCWTESPWSDYARGNTSTLTSVPFSLAGATRPLVRFYHQYIFENVVTSFNTGGELQVSTDGTIYTTVARFYDWLQPWTLCNVDLGDYAGQPSVTLRFRFHSSTIAQQFDGWCIDDVEVYQPASILPEPADFVVESRSPFGITESPAYVESTTGGSWSDSASKATDSHLRALNSRYNLTDALGSTAAFTPLISADGVYEVYAIWGISANASHVLHRVNHAQGTTDVYLDQNGSTNAHQWVSLGTYQFHAGRSQAQGSVLVDESSVTGKPIAASEGRVYADAIRFVYRSALPTSAVAEWMLY